MRVGLFSTCLAESFAPRALIATVKILERLGHTVEFPSEQTCCGQPMFNNGHPREAAALARRMLTIFAGYEAVVTPSASCAGMVRTHFVPLFTAGSPDALRAAELGKRTFELVEFLVRHERVDLKALGARWTGKIAHHYSCHSRLLGMTEEASALLAQVEGVETVPLSKREQCCGFGGTFALRYPRISAQMVGEKVACISDCGAQTVVCSDAGCLLNLEGGASRAGVPVTFLSAAEIVAEALGLLERER